MSTLYLKGLEQMATGNIDWENDTIKLKYMATGYTPNAGTDSFLADVSASEASGAPTETLANAAVNIDSGNGRVELDADDVSSTGITTTTNKFIIYKDTGSAATSPLLAVIDLATTLAPVAGTLSVTFSSDGVFALNAA